MRIGIDARGYRPSLDGIGRYTRNLVCSLLEKDRDNEYIVFGLPESDWSFLSQYSNVRLFKFPYRHLSLATIYKLGPLVDREGIDVFHSLFFVAPKKMKAACIVTVYDLMALTFPRFFSERFIANEILANLYHKIYVPRSIQSADALVAISDFTRQQLREVLNVPSEKITVIYGQPDGAFSEETQQSQDEEKLQRYSLDPGYLLYVGNTKPYKNIDGLFRGYARYCIRSENSHAPLIMVGKEDRFRSRVMKVAETLKIDDKVRFLEEVPDQDLPALMRQALALVQPSHVEGFGLPSLEALACGTPVIASQATALSEVLGRSALLFAPDDTAKLGEHMHRLQNEPQLREKLKREGSQRAAAFRKESSIRELLKLYQKVAKSAGESNS